MQKKSPTKRTASKRAARKRARKPKQELFAFAKQRKAGRGKRLGRPPKGDEPMVSHAVRPWPAQKSQPKPCPLHVSYTVLGDVPSLRTGRALRVLMECFRKGRDRFGFRLIHYSIQGNHMHVIVEGDERESVSRGMQGLAVRMAKRLNKLWGRKGKVFADRYWGRILEGPRQVRNALQYLFQNVRKHRGPQRWGSGDARTPDPFTSGAWFDGWEKPAIPLPALPREGPIAEPRTWVLRGGWKRAGGLLPNDIYAAG